MKKRFSNNHDDVAVKFSDLDNQSLMTDQDIKCGINLMRLMGIFVVCLILLSVLFSVSVVLRDPPSDGVADALPTTVFRESRGIWLFSCF